MKWAITRILPSLLYLVVVKITTSENELIKLLPEGSGNFYADARRKERVIVKLWMVLAVKSVMKCFCEGV